MRAKSRKIGSGSFSFMDLMFGTLGAVVLLLIIMLSLGGPPERIRADATRTVSWDFLTDKDAIKTVKVFLLSEPLLDGQFVNGQWTGTPSDFNNFEWMCECKPDSADTAKMICSLTLSYSTDDDLKLKIQIGGNRLMTISRAKMAVSPGITDKDEKIIDQATRSSDTHTLTSFIRLLKENNGGKSASIETFEFIQEP